MKYLNRYHHKLGLDGPMHEALLGIMEFDPNTYVDRQRNGDGSVSVFAVEDHALVIKLPPPERFME